MQNIFHKSILFVAKSTRNDCLSTVFAFFVSFSMESFAVSGKRANFGCEKAKKLKHSYYET